MWKDINQWESYYEINDSGYIRNKMTGYILKGDKNSAGYYRVCLYNRNHVPTKQRFFVHRLVAEHFIPNPEGLLEVNHRDHNLKHNYVSNLEWCTRDDNELDSRVYGSKEYRPFKVEFSNGDIEVFDTKPKLARKLNITRGLVGY